MKWSIVGFNHPYERHSLIYKQNLTDEGLIKMIQEGIQKGCNLFSIRGNEKEELKEFVGTNDS